MSGLRRFLCFCFLFGCVSGYVDKTVYQYLVDNGYTSFVQLMEEVNLKSTLNGKGPITVFAPSNSVFGKLNPDFMSALAHNPTEKVALAKYHLLNEVFLVPFVPGMTEVITVEGQPLSVWHIGSSIILNNKTHVEPSPNNDIVCSNGVIQPIDNVLVPPVFGGDNIVAVLIERDDIFTEIVVSLITSNLTTLLKSGEYTFFVPMDSAFTELKRDVFDDHVTPEERRTLWTEVLKFHIVPGLRTSTMFKNGQTLFTLHGMPLNITVMSDGHVILNQLTNVVFPDISASNGVIHAIDHIMLPADIKHALRPDLISTLSANYSVHEK